jgi:mono/diheme cytochrome c family protein
MKMMLRIGIMSALFLVQASGAIAADPAKPVAKDFQRCAACHLANGAGVPGAFPRLAGRLGDAAKTDAGRTYLVLTVSAGMSGLIEVDGAKIRGAMPAQAGMKDADIAAALNYALALKDPNSAKAPAASKLFTAAEVAAIKAANAAAKPAAVHALRAGAFAPTAADGAKK